MPSEERVARFRRAVISIQGLLPAQKAQLLFLFGSLFLYAAAFAPWIIFRHEPGVPTWLERYLLWHRFLYLPILPVFLSVGIASFWLCFRPGEEASRKIRRWLFPRLIILI